MIKNPISRRESNKAKTRGAMIRAAKALFRSRGFDDASIEEIAARADVSTPSVYNYFRSKDDLLAAVLLSDIAEAMERAREIVENPPTIAIEAYCALAQTHFDAFERMDRALLRRFTAHAIREQGVSTSTYLGAEDDLRRQVGDLTARLKTEGSLDAELQTSALADLVFSVANSEYYAYILDETASQVDAMDRVRAQLEIVFADRFSPRKPI